MLFSQNKLKKITPHCDCNVLSAQVSCDQYGLFQIVDFLNEKVPLYIPYIVVNATRGLVVAFMAYERYLAVCSPFQYETVLSDGRRRIIGYLLTSYYLIFLVVCSSEFVLLEVMFQLK